MINIPVLIFKNEEMKFFYYDKLWYLGIKLPIDSIDYSYCKYNKQIALTIESQIEDRLDEDYFIDLPINNNYKLINIIQKQNDTIKVLRNFDYKESEKLIMTFDFLINIFTNSKIAILKIS